MWDGLWASGSFQGRILRQSGKKRIGRSSEGIEAEKMASTEDERAQVLNAYKAKVREHREMESRCVSWSLGGAGASARPPKRSSLRRRKIARRLTRGGAGDRVKSMRENVKALVKEYNKTEDDLKALQVRGDRLPGSRHRPGSCE